MFTALKDSRFYNHNLFGFFNWRQRHLARSFCFWEQWYLAGYFLHLLFNGFLSRQTVSCLVVSFDIFNVRHHKTIFRLPGWEVLDSHLSIILLHARIRLSRGFCTLFQEILNMSSRCFFFWKLCLILVIGPLWNGLISEFCPLVKKRSFTALISILTILKLKCVYVVYWWGFNCFSAESLKPHQFSGSVEVFLG